MTQIFTLANNLNPSSLTVDTPRISGGNAGDFAVILDGCTNRTVPLEGSCTFTVRFRPTAAGPRSSTITLDTTSTTHTATLTGIGTVAASLTVTPDTLAFGSQVVATTSAAQAITVKNVGNAAIQVSGTSIAGADFGISGDQCAIATLQPNEECAISVTFTPAATGPAAGTLTIASDAPDGPHTVALSGTGVAPPAGTIALSDHTFPDQAVNTSSAGQLFTITSTGGPVTITSTTIADEGMTHGVTVSPGSLNFGVQAADTPSAPQGITLTNTGSAMLTLGPLGLGGPNPGDYLLVGDFCGGAVLPSGQSCSVGVIFLPAGSGASAATLSIPHSAAAEPYAVGLGGNGGVATDGGTVASATRPEFNLIGDTCSDATLSAEEQCSLTVTFTPALAGERSTTLTVNSTSSGGPTTITLDGNGIANETPQAAITPLLLNFGAQSAGSSTASQVVTVTNTGSGPLQLADVAPGGAAASNFALTYDNCSGATLAPGSSCTVMVAFSPTATGQQNALLAFTDSGPGGPRLVALAGTGTTPGAPTASLSSAELAFGNQQVETSSMSQTLTVTNTGTATLNVGTVLVNGAAFTIATDDCTAAMLAPTEACAIQVSFSPSALGQASGTLTIPSNAASSPDSVDLSGTGIAPPLPSVSLSPTNLSFGNQQTGTASAGQSVTLTNTGSAALTVATVSLSGASGEFSLNGGTCPSVVLNPGDSCAFTVSFSPTTAGEQLATVLVSSNAASSPDSVSLAGVGVAPSFSVSPGSLSFGMQTVGTTSAPQTVTVTNTGSAAATVSAPVIVGDDFAINADTCAATTLPPGGQCSITVRFAPGVVGPANGTLSVASQAVALAGTGVAAPVATTLAVAPASGAYGGSTTLAATLRNSSDTTPIAGKSITFSIGGTSVGSATTGSNGVATLADVALGTRAAGTYANLIVVSFAGADGALPSGGTATLTVSRVTLTVAADNQSRAYGFANPALTVRYEGFVNGDTGAVLRGRPTVSTPATATSAVGNYPITVVQNTLSATNYDFAIANATLTVTPAPLTITAVDKSRAYGAANPALTVRYSGFRQGDNAADLTGSLGLTTAATPASPAGIYPIVVSQGTLSSPNYALAFANGTLTINPVNTALSAVSGAATYGDTATLTATLRAAGGDRAPLAGVSIAFTLGGTAVGSAPTDANGIATLTTVPLGGRGAGTYNNLVRATFAGDADHLGTTATGALRVAKAALVLRAVDQARGVGQDNPSCQVQLAPDSRFVNGDTLASLDLSRLACNYGGANRRSPAGLYSITPRGVRSDNYAITYESGTLTVVP